MESAGKPWTKQAVAEKVGMSVSGLMYYPAIREYFEHLKEAQRSAREDLLLYKTLTAVMELEYSGRRVTQQGVSDIVDVTRVGLRKYARVRFVLDCIAMARHRTEDELVESAESACVVLKALGRPVTQEAIGEMVGMTPCGLRNYPRVKAIFDHISAKRRNHREG